MTKIIIISDNPMSLVGRGTFLSSLPNKIHAPAKLCNLVLLNH